MSKVTLGAGCWVWAAYKTRRGYGRLSLNGVIWNAHRLSWTLHNGPIPDGLYVLHHCDNPSCVRPDHLFLGTQFDNMADMTRKGRAPDRRGSLHGMAILTDDNVLSIRNRFSEARSLKTIRDTADDYGVSYGAISKIVYRTNWPHLNNKGNEKFR